MELRNFELGVLFHSRPGRQYRALSGSCPMHSTKSCLVAEEGVVLLPLPYEVLGGQPYCAESGAFLHRPYFHENQQEVRPAAAPQLA